ncbi:hypothetical protein JTB14_007579 [Gonioctena quinquepunctata]|nr:hypothetical protein JTB14_007579 [Gonioctena quinquepunctata]
MRSSPEMFENSPVALPRRATVDIGNDWNMLTDTSSKTKCVQEKWPCGLEGRELKQELEERNWKQRVKASTPGKTCRRTYTRRSLEENARNLEEKLLENSRSLEENARNLEGKLEENSRNLEEKLLENSRSLEENARNLEEKLQENSRNLEEKLLENSRSLEENARNMEEKLEENYRNLKRSF